MSVDIVLPRGERACGDCVVHADSRGGGGEAPAASGIVRSVRLLLLVPGIEPPTEEESPMRARLSFTRSPGDALSDSFPILSMAAITLTDFPHLFLPFPFTMGSFGEATKFESPPSDFVGVPKDELLRLRFLVGVGEPSMLPSGGVGLSGVPGLAGSAGKACLSSNLFMAMTLATPLLIFFPPLPSIPENLRPTLPPTISISIVPPSPVSPLPPA
mmetsp:Transcript_53112/g.168586  ORF Transcript_53112/g.168586 Transcript_53112/m.168586 type:complete len:215 (-) Transcript_53112:1682-2326(-)